MGPRVARLSWERARRERAGRAWFNVFAVCCGRGAMQVVAKVGGGVEREKKFFVTDPPPSLLLRACIQGRCKRGAKSVRGRLTGRKGFNVLIPGRG